MKLLNLITIELLDPIAMEISISSKNLWKAYKEANIPYSDYHANRRRVKHSVMSYDNFICQDFPQTFVDSTSMTAFLSQWLEALVRRLT